MWSIHRKQWRISMQRMSYGALQKEKGKRIKGIKDDGMIRVKCDME
jgi:hypothetical protein